MKAPRVDRRVQRTRRLLQDALLELILEKGYEAITVQDILDRANLGRSTFYVHYRDKDDLLVSEFERFREMFEEYDAHMSGAAAQAARAPSLSLAFFRHAGEHHELYKAMMGKQGGEVVRKYLYQYVSDLMANHLNRQLAQARQLTVPREILVHYMISSFLSLLTWWLDHDMPYTAERMEEILNALTMSGFKSALAGQQ
jgi:AcrR family transcriptional regulator